MSCALCRWQAGIGRGTQDNCRCGRPVGNCTTLRSTAAVAGLLSAVCWEGAQPHPESWKQVQCRNCWAWRRLPLPLCARVSIARRTASVAQSPGDTLPQLAGHGNPPCREALADLGKSDSILHVPRSWASTARRPVVAASLGRLDTMQHPSHQRPLCDRNAPQPELTTVTQSLCFPRHSLYSVSCCLGCGSEQPTSTHPRPSRCQAIQPHRHRGPSPRRGSRVIVAGSEIRAAKHCESRTLLAVTSPPRRIPRNSQTAAQPWTACAGAG